MEECIVEKLLRVWNIEYINKLAAMPYLWGAPLYFYGGRIRDRSEIYRRAWWYFIKFIRGIIYPDDPAPATVAFGKISFCNDAGWIFLICMVAFVAAQNENCGYKNEK